MDMLVELRLLEEWRREMEFLWAQPDLVMCFFAFCCIQETLGRKSFRNSSLLSFLEHLRLSVFPSKQTQPVLCSASFPM